MALLFVVCSQNVSLKPTANFSIDNCFRGDYDEVSQTQMLRWDFINQQTINIMSIGRYKATGRQPETSLASLKGKSGGLNSSIEDDEYEMQRMQAKQAKKKGLDHLYKEDYQPAKYKKALAYRNARSYMKKLPSGHYKELDLFEDTEQLKHFGLGAYFYIEFMRRLVWLFLVLTLLEGIVIYIDWIGDGMSAYSESFSTYLIKATMANYTKNKFTSYDGWIVTIVPAICYFSLLIFYLIWKVHYYGTIAEQEEDNADVKPQKFTLEIQGLEETFLSEDELKTFFSSFGPVYEVSLVRRYKNKLTYFQELDELEEEIKQEELEVILGGGDKAHVESLKKEKAKLNKEISKMQIYPKTVSAYIHFEYEKSKADCLTYFNDHYLFNSCSHNCMRGCCCCCVNQPQEKYLFFGEKLLIKNDKVPSPEDINWSSFELTGCSQFCRGCFAFLIILVFLAISCAIIGLCSIYIASHASNCQDVTLPASLSDAQAETNTTVLQCYCDAHLVDTFSNQDYKQLCKDYLQNIYISQGIQYAVIATSAFTNWLFGKVVDKLIGCVRPQSRASGQILKTIVYTCFLIFNTICVPLLVYADIFGFTPSNYISFVTIISTDVHNFFAVQNLSFYPDFNEVWYRNLSPIYVNFMVLNTIFVWFFLCFEKCLASKQSLEDDEGKILQKHMNEQITSYKLDVYKEVSYTYLTLVMAALFFPGIPALIPLSFFNMFSRYVFCRSLLQNNSSKVLGLSEDYLRFSLTLLVWILIVCPLIGEWMLVATDQIYPDQLPFTLPVLQGHTVELDKQLYLPFYIIIALIAAFEFFLWNTLIRCCTCLCSLCYQRKLTSHPYHTRPFKQYAKGMNVIHSYNIRNNDEMRNVILNLEKYLVDKQLD